MAMNDRSIILERLQSANESRSRTAHPGPAAPPAAGNLNGKARLDRFIAEAEKQYASIAISAALMICRRMSLAGCAIRICRNNALSHRSLKIWGGRRRKMALLRSGQVPPVPPIWWGSALPSVLPQKLAQC